MLEFQISLSVDIILTNLICFDRCWTYLWVNWNGSVFAELFSRHLTASAVKILFFGYTIICYSQTRILCSRPICSLPGLQGQKPKAHYYFTFWDSTISVFMKFLWNQPVLSYSTHGSQKSAANQKNREKTIFQAQFWSTSNQ